MTCLVCKNTKFTTYQSMSGEIIWECTNPNCGHTFYLVDGEFIHTACVEKA